MSSRLSLPDHGFHFNGTLFYRSTHWLHLGWDDANAAAYSALVAFCQKTGRRWITSYARDRRAELDADFFGWEYPLREERLKAIFGPPQQTGRGKDQTDSPENYTRPSSKD